MSDFIDIMVTQKVNVKMKTVHFVQTRRNWKILTKTNYANFVGRCHCSDSDFYDSDI